MKPAIDPRDKIDEAGASVDASHVDWFREKVERGLAERRTRESLIPIEQIWRDLKGDG